MYKSFGAYMVSFLGVESLGQRVDVCLMKNSKTFSKVGVPFSLPPATLASCSNIVLFILAILVGGL